MRQNPSIAALIVLLALGAPGCTSDDLPAEATTTTGTSSTSEPTTTTPTEAYEPDQWPCYPPIVACSNDEECCATTPEISCEVYPNKWTCEGGICVQGGCESDTDCRDLISSFSCLEVITGVFQCVAACASDPECGNKHSMPNTVCEGTSLTQNFCIEAI